MTLDQAIALIQGGEIVAIPTETVYGLAANALDPNAVAKIFAKKQRPTFHPLILHEASAEKAFSHVKDVPEEARQLARMFWPGPLTLVLEKADHVPLIVTGGMSTLGIRVPRHPLTLELIARAGVPVAAPSANAFGKVSPTTAAHVAESLDVPVLDGGACGVGLESTILGWTGNHFRLLRLGGLSVEAIEQVVGEIEKPSHQKSIAPGMLKSHYQPTTRLKFREPGHRPTGPGIGLLTLCGREAGFEKIVELSPSGDLEEAAAKFFDVLRSLDKSGLQEIWADLMPDSGLGRAINDRLTRAVH